MYGAGFRSISKIIFSLILFYSPVFSQEDFSFGHFQGATHIMLGFPQDEFKDKIDRLGYGVNIDFGYVFPGLPVVAGVTGGIVNYGSRSFRVPFNYQIQTVYVEMNTSNNIGLIHPFVRFQPQSGIFRPYFEGMFGLHYLWTYSTVSDERYSDAEIAGSTNLSDIAFSYGAGGGVMFQVYKGSDNETSAGMEMFVDLRFRYLFGGEAKYFTENSIRDANGILVLDEHYADKSATNMMFVMLGVAIRM